MMELKIGEMVLLRNAEDEQGKELRLVFQARRYYYAYANPVDSTLTCYLIGEAIPKQIPLSEDDWPMGYTIIRLKVGGGFRVVTGATSIGVITTGSALSYKYLFNEYEMSQDSGVSWHPCGKEA